MSEKIKKYILWVNKSIENGLGIKLIRLFTINEK